MTKDEERGLVRQALIEAALPTSEAPEPFAGLGVGISAEDLSLPDNTVHISPEQSEIMRAFERTRIVRALESLDETAELTLVAQQRIAEASERQAAALENIAAMFAGCIGTGASACAGASSSDPYEVHNVLYLRTGEGRRNFGCDRSTELDDDLD